MVIQKQKLADVKIMTNNNELHSVLIQNKMSLIIIFSPMSQFFDSFMIFTIWLWFLFLYREAFVDLTRDIFELVRSGDIKIQDGWEGVKSGFVPNTVHSSEEVAKGSRQCLCWFTHLQHAMWQLTADPSYLGCTQASFLGLTIFSCSVYFYI